MAGLGQTEWAGNGSSRDWLARNGREGVLDSATAVLVRMMEHGKCFVLHVCRAS